MSKKIEGLAGEYLLKLATVASRIDLFNAFDRDTEDQLWFLTCIAEYGYVYRYKGLTVTSVLKLATEEIMGAATEGVGCPPQTTPPGKPGTDPDE